MKKISFLMMIIICLSGCYEEVPTGIDLSSIQKDNTRPSCSIFAPANYSNYVAGSSMSIQVNASDEENNLSNVKIYLDNNLKTTISSQPFTYSLNTTNMSNGAHIIKAIATDSQNAVSPESYVNITITASNGNNPPECSITSPANNSSSAIGATMTISANAMDSDGSISEVRFYIDGLLKSTDLTEPYSYAWNTTGQTSGNHTIKVVAKDNLNFETEKSIAISLTSGGTSIQVTGVSLNFTTANLTVNQTKLLTATITPTDASNQTVFWSSSNSNIATVVNGLVTAKSAGNATITVRTEDGGFTDNSIVNVTNSSVPEGFVFVEGGSFQIGNHDYESPVHTVTLSSYSIGKYEVTQTEWIATMGYNPSYFTGNNSRPVEMVSLYDVLVYCNKRSIDEGLTPVYTINGSTDPANWGSVPTSSSIIWNAVICNWTAKGYRLPTEAEWEFAAKGGKNSQGYAYSGSDDLNAVAWYASNSGDTTHPVATKAPNELGLYDMSGNIWEWSWDWYAYYNSNPQTNPHGPGTGSYRVIRGNSYAWGTYTWYWCVWYRKMCEPYGGGSALGFRLARSL